MYSKYVSIKSNIIADVLKWVGFDSTLPTHDIPQKNFIMAYYTVSLASNETAFCRTIKAPMFNLHLSDTENWHFSKTFLIQHKFVTTKISL